MVFRPLAGCGLFLCTHEKSRTRCRFRPLAGCGLFLESNGEFDAYERFPSPCGVWVVSLLPQRRSGRYGFRPLAGCGLFPSGRCLRHGLSGVSVPLRGVGCFQYGYNKDTDYKSFRPLAGCGLFPSAQESMDIKKVSVPLRGVGCFQTLTDEQKAQAFPSPCGVWVVSITGDIVCYFHNLFPSPCGVWVVSAKLHILSGVTGKRIVNSAILLYHIGRCLSIAN